MKKELGFVYLIQSLDLYKIGMCTSRYEHPHGIKFSQDRLEKGVMGDLMKRVSVYFVHNPHDVKLLDFALVPNCKNLERDLQNLYDEKRVRGEWFRFNKIEVEHIKNILARQNLNGK